MVDKDVVGSIGQCRGPWGPRAGKPGGWDGGLGGPMRGYSGMI